MYAEDGGSGRVGRVRNWWYVPVGTEVLAEDAIVRLAYFAVLRGGESVTVICSTMIGTYDKFEVLGECEADNGEHALERVIGVINSVIIG